MVVVAVYMAQLFTLEGAEREKNEKKLKAGQLVTGSGQGRGAEAGGRGVPTVPAVPGRAVPGREGGGTAAASVPADGGEVDGGGGDGDGGGGEGDGGIVQNKSKGYFVEC